MKTHKNNWEERFDDSFSRPLKKEFIDDLEKTYKDTEFVLEPVKNVKGFIRQELASQKEEIEKEFRDWFDGKGNWAKDVPIETAMEIIFDNEDN